MTEGGIVLRSYRLAFQLERRIHRVDRYRIPLPYGLPLAVAGVALAVVVIVVALGRLPVVGALLGQLPLPVRLVFVPGAAAHVLCRTQTDGRRVYEALMARVLWLLRPRCLVALARRPPQGSQHLGAITIVSDERTGALRPAVVPGPAEVLVRESAQASFNRRRLELRPSGGEPMPVPVAVRLRSAEHLVIR